MSCAPVCHGVIFRSNMALIPLFIIDLTAPSRSCLHDLPGNGSKAGIWDRIMDAVVDAHNGDVVMIDGTSVRVHHAAVTLKKATCNDAWEARAAG